MLTFVSSFFAVLERDTCHLQIPKGHNPRKQGWKDVVSGCVDVCVHVCVHVWSIPPLLSSPPPPPPLLLSPLLPLLPPPSSPPSPSSPHAQFMVMSFTTKKLLLYEREDDLETGAPISTLEFR